METLDAREEARCRAIFPRSDRVFPILAGNRDRQYKLRHHDFDRSDSGERRLQCHSGRQECLARFPYRTFKATLSQRLIPTITTWNRLEGRPRSQSFERALQAEVRDALWMLTKQWQMGEFRGSDAGSPVFARLLMQTTRLTKYQPAGGKPEIFDSATPLETKVERRPIPLHRQGSDPLARPPAGDGAPMVRADRRTSPGTTDRLTSRPIQSPSPIPSQKSNVDVCCSS